MAVAGTIEIELTAKDGGFTAQVRNAGGLLRTFQTSADSTARSVRRLEEAQFSLGTRFRHLVLTLGNLRFAAMDVYDVFLRLPKAILDSAGELERTEALLKGLSTQLTDLGKAAEGKRDFTFITDLAQKAPFALNSLADGFVKLKSAGVAPLQASMNALVDSVARFGGNDESFKRASIAIQQMVGKGVVSMEELRQQLGEAIPTAMRAMADGMGLSMAELAKQIKTGTVEARSAIGKMLAQMHIENAGAAAEMMKTWVGTLAQLKTRWQLTTREIADAGFFEAMKKALDELSKALTTSEFKRFALSVGDALGQTVTAGVAFIKWLHEVKDVLLLGAQAFLLYQATTKLLLPAIQAAQGGVQKFAEVYRKLNADKIALANQATRREIETTKSIVSELGRQQAAHQATVDSRRRLIANMESAAEAHANRMQVIQRRLRASEAPSGGAAITDPRFAQRAALQRALDQENQAYLRNRRALEQMERQMLASQVAYQRIGGAIETSERRLHQLEGTQNSVTRGAKALSAAKAVLGGALAAVGGPLGLLLIGLQVGALAWLNWGQKAEQAAERAKRAMRGISTTQDLQEAQAQIQRLQTEMAQSDAAVARLKKAPDNSSNRFYLEEATKENALKKAALLKAQDELGRIRAAVDKQERADKATMIENQVTDAITKVRDSYNATINAERSALQKRLEAVQGNVAAEERVRKEGMKKIQALSIEQTRSLVRGYDAGIAALREAQPRATGADAGAIQDAIERLEQQKRLAEEQRTLQESLEKPNVRIVTDDDKLTKDTPIQRLIERLKSDEQELEAQLAGIGSKLGELDRIAGEIARIDQKNKNGDFNFKTGKDDKAKSGRATDAELDEAKKRARNVEIQKQIVADYGKVTQQIDALAPRYQEAMEILANPLDTARGGPAQRGVAKLLEEFEGNPERLSRLAQRMGTSADELKEKLSAQAATIDFAPLYQRMVQETDQMNAAMVEDSREAAKKRKETEDDVFNHVMQLHISRLRAAGATTKQIQAIEQSLADHMAARARTNAVALAGPMEKMLANWRNVTRNMEEATAHWTDQSIDKITELAVKGKADFGELTKAILADILRIQLRAQYGEMIGGMMKGIGSLFTMENGGIMNSLGSMPLRRYAAGGIAKSPQLAMFGEGDMAEAYVPLPDGRRIPVAMQGGTPGVVVNVINQTSQAVDASQGQPRFDGKQMVLDVVLTAAAQPGPFRDGMRNMMGR
jgi:tape measure domain-containing protein